MKVLATKNFQQMKFKLLGINEEWSPTLGDLPASFMITVFGASGGGKTEFCIQFAKLLAGFGKVVWLSYEQGHGYDLQKAVNRNKMEEVAGNFKVVDPLANIKDDGKREMRDLLYDDLVKHAKKRGWARFIFIDSYDYTEFTFEQYKELKRKFKNISVIWISHINDAGTLPDTKVAKRIARDGVLTIKVKKFIATPLKNRFGGYEDYIIYEKRARELNPLYFAQKEGNADEAPAPKKRGRKPKQKQ